MDNSMSSSIWFIEKFLLGLTILIYPNPNEHCHLYTDTSKYIWETLLILTQIFTYKYSVGKTIDTYHPVIYLSGSFSEIQ